MNNYYPDLTDKDILFRFGGRHTGLKYHNIKMYVNKICKLEDIKNKVLLCKDSNYMIYVDLIRVNYPDIYNDIIIKICDDLPDYVEGILIDKDIYFKGVDSYEKIF